MKLEKIEYQLERIAESLEKQHTTQNKIEEHLCIIAFTLVNEDEIEDKK